VRRSRQGQALAEFALVIPIILLAFMGIFDLGRMIFAYNNISNAAREGARTAIVNQNQAAIEAEARIGTTGLAPSDVNVPVRVITCTPVTPVRIGCLISVRVDYTWRPLTPIIGNIVGPITLSATTAMPIEHVAP
jgi:Flp pilus assembly protein TadG